MDNLERRIAEGLLSIRAVFFRPNEPFIWASGIKSPVYCDNRLILTAPAVRTQVETALMQVVRQEYPEAEVLMGTSTAGIPHAAIVAQMMGLPMGYVRGSGKDHGRKNQIEGRLEPGQKVVVIEDLISTGQHFYLRDAEGPEPPGEGQREKPQPYKFRRHCRRRGRTEIYSAGGCRPADPVPRQPGRRILDWRRKIT